MGHIKAFRDIKLSRKATVINTIMVAFMVFFTVFYSSYTPYYGSVDTNMTALMRVLYAIRYVPCMIVAAVCGCVPGLVGVMIAFIYRSVVDSVFSYMTFIYLLVVIVMNTCTRKRMFDKWYKALLMTVIMQNLVGIFWGLTLLTLTVNGISTISFYQLLCFFIYEFPGCAIGCFSVYCIFRYTSDDNKLLFDNGKFYVPKEKLDYDDLYIVEGKSKLGKVVTDIIVHEAIILGVAAEIASNVLVPNMKEYSYLEESVEAEVSFADIRSTEHLEAMVSRELFDEIEVEGGTGLGAAIVTTGTNYRYSVRLAMLICMLTIPLSVFFNRYAQYRIAKPIRRLSKGVSGIYNADEKSLHDSAVEIHKLDIDTDDEIEELYRSINMTTYKMEDYIDLLKYRQKMEDELVIEKSANEAKSRFLTNVSHEIRTPINAVLGFDEMILRESHNENILSYARDIKNSGKILLSLINDLLDFSKIEAGKMEIVPVEYELGSVLNDVINMADVRAKEKNLKVIVNVNEEIPHILFGDEIRLKQCMVNLMTNAIKYTDKGSVTLSMDYEEDRSDPEKEKVILCVSVEDTGMGIKSEDMEKLTKAFERIDEKNNRTIEGTGLGLSIVVSMLELMGSELTVESRYQKGSTFSFRLCQDVVDCEPLGNFTQRVRDSQENTVGYKESFHAENARILVVDDTKTNLTVIDGLLKKTRMQVELALSGREALELVKNNKYDMIFLDHRMPDMDGIQTLHAIKDLKDNPNHDVPFIALTANAISGSREMYINEGFDNYMSKPVVGVKLEEMILSYLPKELVTLPTDPGFESISDDEKNSERIVIQELLTLSGIDVESAVERCGSAVNVKNVIKDFYLTIDDRSSKIEEYFNERDIRNYTIYVHGLKSSARAIGAIDLSEKAAYLEECGNKAKRDEIEKLTPELLDLYRSYKDKLKILFISEDDDKKILIGEDELLSAFSDIKECVEGSFFDSADEIMEMLEEYRIPDAYKDKYKELKSLMSAVDRDGIIKLL